ncbi:MAG: type II toxin-antitoxin system RelE/ParE family toxin [Actinobacteria bacterium]|nr:type II toxin-antitoxin system RelE/ParE family toxin [Actinomycetota bacterium]MBU1494351.1 type II toxin-antitoxin system RelE/ParE family toxin [Actinomycetota bacterium]MBU1866389.1 type II toxin-antitoxin system RelE/ParE family toxin [Actinomycetota bacterium]
MPWLTKRAEKDLAALPPGIAKKAREVFSELDANPKAGYKLMGRLQGKRAARLGRAHRIIYVVEDRGAVILTISQRKDSYR